MTMPSGGRAHHIGVKPNGAHAWVTNHGAEGSVFDVPDRRLLRRVAVGPDPHHVAVQ